MSKKFWVLTGVLVFIVGLVLIGRLGNVEPGRLGVVGNNLLFPFIFAAALVDSVHPCGLSVLLLTIAFLVSMQATRKRILAAGGFYIAGIFLAYFAIGLGILQALQLFGVPHGMSRLTAYILIVVGILSLLNYFVPTFPIKLKIPSASHRPIARLMERGTLLAVFLLGLFVGISEFPCTGGPYLLVLGLLHDQGTHLLGLGYLVLYNFVFVIPLIVLLGIGSDPTILKKVETWKKKETGRMRLWGGLGAIALGGLILLL